MICLEISLFLGKIDQISGRNSDCPDDIEPKPLVHDSLFESDLDHVSQAAFA
jgi:hypothetical protein